MKRILIAAVLFCTPVWAKPTTPPKKSAPVNPVPKAAQTQSERRAEQDRYALKMGKWTHGLAAMRRLPWPRNSQATATDEEYEQGLENILLIGLACKGVLSEHQQTRVPAEFKEGDQLLINALSVFESASDKFFAGDPTAGDDFRLGGQIADDATRTLLVTINKLKADRGIP